MTFKALAQAKDVTQLAAQTVRRTTLYTVPAAKKAFIKEIILIERTGMGANFRMHFYVLPTGATDDTATADVPNNDALVVATKVDSNAVTVTVYARNLVLEAGDVLKLRLYNLSVSPQTPNITVLVSGDES